jgi:hypothetical protein
MKLAKASKADLDMAYELVGAFNAMTNQWSPLVPRGCEEEPEEPLDLDDPLQCYRILKYLIDLSDSASLGRVVMGAAVMLDPRNQCVDPDADTIEHHPLTLAAKAAKQARPLAEYHEDQGVVLWWKFPVDEPPYMGTPLDYEWPGYHTHWTPLIVPDAPQAAA